ncbi:MAG: phosphate ABC transporter permease subunit PstC [Bacteroidota bacterium]
MNSFHIRRLLKNKFHTVWMIAALVFAMTLPVLLAIGLYYKASGLLMAQSFFGMVFSKDWRPLSGHFGLFPFIISSLWVTILALLIAGPICLFSAIHLTQYAKSYVLKVMHPVIDILAGIPSVLFGVWGVVVIVPFVSQHIAPLFGKQTSGYTIMSGGIVLAVMIIPFVLNILIEVFKSIPEELTEVTLSLGATRWMVVKHILMRKAFPGIVSAFGLGLSRAFGETIAVLMVVGNVTRIPHGALQPGYPLPALIANNYGEMLSIPMYDSALMLAAFVLLIIVILFNFISRMVIYRMLKIM